MTKEYICECGRKFDKPQSFNGHKSNCVIHLEKTGKLAARKQSRKIGAKKSALASSQTAAKRRECALAQWIAEQHACEKCGMIMTEKFSSGRFCSRACANSRERSEGTKQKIRTAIANHNAEIRSKSTYVNALPNNHSLQRHFSCKAAYEASPRLCVICNTAIRYERREYKTCSDYCYRKLLSQSMKQRVAEAGGNFNTKGPGASKYGTYKGYHCDSSWELAFVIYHLEQNIPFTRNTESFSYLFNGAEHKYYPDFIVDDTYIEIKNYDSYRNKAKREQFPKDKKLKTFFRKEMQPYLDYCINKYGTEFYTLYDQDKPSWMNKNMEV